MGGCCRSVIVSSLHYMFSHHWMELGQNRIDIVSDCQNHMMLNIHPTQTRMTTCHPLKWIKDVWFEERVLGQIKHYKQADEKALCQKALRWRIWEYI